jgi:hypothetical protein
MPKATKFDYPIVVLHEQYECIAFECRHCGVKITEGITAELIYNMHAGHLESVTLEIEIVNTGEVWEVQPLPKYVC